MSELVLVGAAIGALAATATLGYGIRECTLAVRLYRNEPDSVLTASEGGAVELSGSVSPAEDVLESPFTETDCVALEYVVEERRRKRSSNSGSRTKWVDIDSQSGGVPFYLEDDSGSVLVDPTGADFRLSDDARIRVDGGEEPPAPIAEFIAADEDISDENTGFALGPVELSTGRDRRYIERRLDVGGTAHLLGTARYDTTISKEAGQVNAIVESAAPTDAGLVTRLRHRLTGPRFLLFDVPEGQAARRVAYRGIFWILVAILIGVLVALFGGPAVETTLA